MNRHEKRILIVEDETIAAMAIEDMIEKMDYQVCASVSFGEEAVKLAFAERPDLVLMDIHIHGQVDGIEAAARIRDLQIPIIFTTGYFDARMKKKAAALKPVAYLVKPLDHDQLKSIIDSVLR
jgi:two-component system, response regulator PdtaR